MPPWSLSGPGPGRGPQGGGMTAATTRKSKPNESRSFPDPSATRDAAAAPRCTHLPHELCDNSSSSTGFHSPYDDSFLFFFLPYFLKFIICSSQCAAPPPPPPSMGCPLLYHHWEKLVFLVVLSDTYWTT